MSRISKYAILFVVVLAAFGLTQCTSETLVDVMQAVFSLTVTSPNGGEVVVPEIPVEITWSTSHAQAVQIDLLKSETLHSSITSSTENSGSYTWNIPANHELGDDFKIRIRSAGDEAFGDTSNSTFTISKLSFTSPVSGQVVGDGDTLSILWEGNLDNELTANLRLYKAGVHVSDIVIGDSNDGSYDWVLPGNLTNGNDYTLKIENSATTDSNESPEFIIINSIAIVSPNGSEVVASGTDVNIEWSPAYAGAVRLDLLDSGTPVTTLSAAANNGVYTWSVPLNTYGGTQLTIEASLGALNSIQDVSDSDFIILDMPTGLQAGYGTSVFSIDLTWNPVAGATTYSVYRSDGGPYSSLGSTASTSYSDSFPIPDPFPQVYTYYVRARSGGTYSQNSNTRQGARNRNFTYQWSVGSTGTGNDQFDAPTDVAVAYNQITPASSYIYVTDQANNRVKRMSSTGVFINAWGSAGSGDSQFDTIWGIAADYWNDRVYVAGDDRIQVFQLDGTFVEWWGWDSIQGTGVHGPGTASNPGYGSGDGQFDNVIDVEVDDNYVYTVEYNNHRVQRFAKNGTFQGWWGLDSVEGSGWHPPGTASSPTYGSANGEFNYPWSIVAIDSSQVVVNDFSNFRLQKFSDGGDFVEAFPINVFGFMDYDGEGHIYTAEGTGFRMYGIDGSLFGHFGIAGTGNGEFANAYGIAVIPNFNPALANVNIADTNNDRMQVIWRLE